MTRLVHLSDLHFGLDHPGLLEPLIAAVNGCGADAVVVTGDLTHRAKESQFARARGFLDRVDAPTLVVPGNHDIPLRRPVERVLRPFGRFRRYLQAEIEPALEVGGLHISGVNTVNRWRWERGRLSASAISRILPPRGAAEAGAVQVMAAHHPIFRPRASTKAATLGARRAVERIAAAGGALVYLCGHVHRFRVDAVPCAAGNAPVLQAQTGSALSTRKGDPVHDFLALDFDGDAVTIDRWLAPDGGNSYRPGERRRFSRDMRGWHPG